MAVVALVVLAVLGLVAGLLTLSQATVGVGAVGAACLFAIFARMAQANRQHQQLVDTLRAAAGLDQPPAAPARADDRWTCPACGYANGAQFFDCTRCRAQRP